MTLHRERPFHRRTGGVLAASLILVTLIASLGAGLIRLQTIVTRRHVQSVDHKRALYVAEAGVAEAFAAISLGKTGNVGTAEKPAAFGNGVYWVEAEDIDAERVRLTSNGLCGIGRFSITVVVRRSVNPVGLHGSFGRRGIQVGNRSVIDGFDSRTGTYAQQIDTSLAQVSTGLGANLTSNQDIDIEGGFLPYTAFSSSSTTFIFGDARPGPKGIVSADPGVQIDGSTVPLPKRVVLPPLVIPQITDTQGNLDISKGASTSIGGAELRYDRILAAKGAELVLQGPLTLVTSIFVLRKNSKLIIDTTDGPVTIHVTDALAFEEGSTLENVTGDSTQVGLFLGDLEGDEVWTRRDLGTDYELDGSEGTMGMSGSTSTEPARLVFEAGGVFNGLIYAPFSELTIPDELRVMGAIAARHVTFEPNSHFSFDKALESTGAGIDALPRILTWRIDDLPDIPLVKVRIDPLATLSLAGITPKRSNRAHREFAGELRYIDGAGVAQTFTGDIDAFVWAGVKKVTSVRWEDPVTTVLAPPKVPVGNYTSESINSVTVVPY